MDDGLSILDYSYMRHSLMADLNAKMLEIVVLANLYNSTHPFYTPEMEEQGKTLRLALADKIEIL